MLRYQSITTVQKRAANTQKQSEYPGCNWKLHKANNCLFSANGVASKGAAIISPWNGAVHPKDHFLYLWHEGQAEMIPALFRMNASTASDSFV